MARCPDGKMEPEEFKKIFRLAFPERPEDKLDLLAAKVANVEKTDGKIPLHTIGMLLYLFCDGKTEDNLGQMFNLFDEDGNGSINVEELLNMMAFFIEIGGYFIYELKSMLFAYIKFCIETSRSAPIVSMTGADAG